MSLPEVTFSRLCIKRAREKKTIFDAVYLQNGLLCNPLKRNGIKPGEQEAKNNQEAISKIISSNYRVAII